MSEINLRESGNVLAGGCQENGCQALQWNVSLNRYRAALEHIDTLTRYQGRPERALALIYQEVREALEGPFAPGPQTDANAANKGPADA